MAGRLWITLGALSAAIGVIAGAIGSHLLKDVWKFPDSELQTYEVAVRYQMYHALGLILVGLLLVGHDSRWLAAAGLAFVAGSLLFSGGLYAWLFTGLTPLVHVVPVGGLVWIVGWLCLAVAGYTSTARRP